MAAKDVSCSYGIEVKKGNGLIGQSGNDYESYQSHRENCVPIEINWIEGQAGTAKVSNKSDEGLKTEVRRNLDSLGQQSRQEEKRREREQRKRNRLFSENIVIIKSSIFVQVYDTMNVTHTAHFEPLVFWRKSQLYLFMLFSSQKPCFICSEDIRTPCGVCFLSDL